ncbi:class IIb bacteriocin, lactobin A/cerein 7B family [Pseudomonas syringae pv. tagetis]
MNKESIKRELTNEELAQISGGISL